MTPDEGSQTDGAESIYRRYVDRNINGSSASLDDWFHRGLVGLCRPENPTVQVGADAAWRAGRDIAHRLKESGAPMNDRNSSHDA